MINPSKYTQHNLGAEDGLAGFGRHVAALPAGSAKVNTIHVFRTATSSSLRQEQGTGAALETMAKAGVTITYDRPHERLAAFAQFEPHSPILFENRWRNDETDRPRTPRAEDATGHAANSDSGGGSSTFRMTTSR